MSLTSKSPFHVIRKQSNLLVKSKYISCVAKEMQVNAFCCFHSTTIETLEALNEKKRYIISVVLRAMQFSTTDFNAPQIIIESGRFYLREPLIFHQCNIFPTFNEWQLIAVSPLGMALLFDRKCHILVVLFSWPVRCSTRLWNLSTTLVSDLCGPTEMSGKHFMCEAPLLFLLNCIYNFIIRLRLRRAVLH